MRARLAIDFAAADPASLALNAAGESPPGEEGGGAWGPLSFALPRLSLWLRVCAHDEADVLSKQLNDKERIAAALTTPTIRAFVINSMQLEEY